MGDKLSLKYPMLLLIKISDSVNDVLILDFIPQQFPFSLKEKKSWMTNGALNLNGKKYAAILKICIPPPA